MTFRLRRLAGIAISLAGGLTACRADGPVSPLSLDPTPRPAVAGMLTGRVTLLESQAPLSGANAVLMSLDGHGIQSVGTDESGVYAFKPVPPGTYRVRVRAIGYAPSVSAPISIDASTAELPSVSMRKDRLGFMCNLVIVGVQSSTGQKRATTEPPASVVPLDSMPVPPQQPRSKPPKS
jgi:hypothetical protein